MSLKLSEEAVGALSDCIGFLVDLARKNRQQNQNPTPVTDTTTQNTLIGTIPMDNEAEKQPTKK